MKQEFHLILDLNELTDAIADALFEAGFDDSHLTRRHNHVCIVIDDRDTNNLAATVRAAVADAHRAGVKVLRVEIPAMELINSELATSLTS